MTKNACAQPSRAANWRSFLALFLIGAAAGARPLLGQNAPSAVTGQVLALVLGRPAWAAPPPGAHQQVVLMRLSDGSLAVVTYRFTKPADRLPRSFFDPSTIRTVAVSPGAGCPAHLRDLMFSTRPDPKTGTPVRAMMLARLPGVKPEAISANLGDSVACYLAAPGSLAAGGAR